MLKRFLRRLGLAEPAARLAVDPEGEFSGGYFYTPPPADRLDYDREEVLQQALEAWRSDPLARRLVQMTSEYVTGGGLRLRCAPAEGEAARFLREWWEHPLNRVTAVCADWCEELSRSGELFFLLSTDRGGMSYVRAVPAAQVREVHCAAGDILQEEGYTLAGAGWAEERYLAAWNPALAPRNGEGNLEPVMLHFAVNRPVGALRGESDLAPLLRWLARYSGWLEDRVRLNRWRNTFAFVVRTRFASEEERWARQRALTAMPPGPGSILVVDESESWEVINPRLESQEAGEDGLALKRMIAAGAGVPLHFLAEPEGSTRTTAESAGGPAYRRFEERQRFFCRMLAELAQAALGRHAQSCGVRLEAQVWVEGGDLSARDNAEMAAAARDAAAALEGLFDRGLVEAEEVRRLVYRFMGETAGEKEVRHG